MGIKIYNVRTDVISQKYSTCRHIDELREYSGIGNDRVASVARILRRET